MLTPTNRPPYPQTYLQSAIDMLSDSGIIILSHNYITSLQLQDICNLLH